MGKRGGSKTIPYYAREKVGSALMGFGCIGGLYCTIRRCWVSFSDGDRIKARCHVITVLRWRHSNALDKLKNYALEDKNERQKQVQRAFCGSGLTDSDQYDAKCGKAGLK